MIDEMKRECNRVGLNLREVIQRWEEKITAPGQREKGGHLVSSYSFHSARI